MSTPLGDHEHRHEPRRRAGGEPGDPGGGVRRVGGDDLRPLAGDPRQAGGEALGVLLVDRDHETTRVRMVARAQVDQLTVGVGEHVGDPVTLRVERRAQPSRGLGGREPRR
jgi:hypothetical protein